MADTLLLASTRVSPVKLQESGFTFQYPELDGALAKRVLQSQALLVGHHLMGRRLPDVHDRPSRQV